MVLQESLNELSGLEELNKTYKELRDQAIKDLYNVGISAQSLATTTELTRQMIIGLLSKQPLLLKGGLSTSRKGI